MVASVRYVLPEDQAAQLVCDSLCTALMFSSCSFLVKGPDMLLEREGPARCSDAETLH